MKKAFTINQKYPDALKAQVYADAAAGWTMAEIARRTGLPYTTVTYWLRINQRGAIADIEAAEDADYEDERSV